MNATKNTKEKTKEAGDSSRSERSPRPEKVAIVEELKTLFKDSQGVVFTEYRGLDVSSMAELRSSLSQAGASFKIYKNTLVRRAIEDLKLKELEGLVAGPVGLAFVKPDADYSETARALADYKKAHDVFLIKGGFSDSQLMDAEEFEVFSKLPPLAVLQAQLAGALQAPLSNLAGLFGAVLQKFAGQLSALKDKVAETEAPTETPTESEPETETETAVETETETETAAETEAPTEAEPEPETETETKPEAEPEAQEESAEQTESTEPETQEEAQAETKTQSEGEGSAGETADTDEAEPETPAEPEAGEAQEESAEATEPTEPEAGEESADQVEPEEKSE